MSRYVKNAIDKTIIYGKDHALGYFYEEWITSQMDNEDSVPFTDRCQMFGMKKEEMLDKLRQYRCKKSHIEAVERGAAF